MKHHITFIALFFLSWGSFAQDHEPPPVKGQLTEIPVMPTLSVYETKSTILNLTPGDSEWNMGGWNVGTVGNQKVFLTGRYHDGHTYALESPGIYLPELQSPSERLNLYLTESYELEDHYDKGLIQISEDDGQTWQVLSERSGRSQLRTSVINLSAYAAKTVRLRLNLKADDSNSYEGWTINNIQLKHDVLPLTMGNALTPRNKRSARTMSTLTGNLSGLDAQKFPRFIFANLTVDDGGVPLNTLDETNFSVIETINDSLPDVRTVEKDNTFKVFAPQNDSTIRPVDIVFLMDNSGSMQQPQAAVAANVESFVNRLDSLNFNYRLALCRFGQGTGGGAPIFHNNARWYSDGAEFVNVWNTVNTVNGSREPSWDAMYFSAIEYTFRSAAQRVFIHIVNESMTGNQQNINFSQITDQQVVISQLQNAGITNYSIVPDSTLPWGETAADFERDFGTIATATGGRTFPLDGSFNDILNEIGTQISNTYTIRYTPTKPAFDGLRRDVKIMIDYNSDTLSLLDDYTPGAAPAVFRTDATLDIHKAAQLNQSPVTIQVDAVDRIALFTQSVSMFYRTVGSSDQYKELTMTQVGTGTTSKRYTADIPGIDVVSPGIEYYIRASDGGATTTAPEIIDREGYPWSFAVLPNLPPVVTNRTQSASLKEGDVINFEAEAIDTTNSIGGVWVWVQEPDELGFQQYPMTSAGGDLYTFNGLTLKQGVTEYYIVAEDNFGVDTFDGSELNPFAISTEIPWEVNTNSPIRHTINLAGFDFSSFPPIWSIDAKMGIDPLNIGDFIGVFYTDQVCDGQGSCETVERCGGFYRWNGPPTIASFFAYGDDTSTPEKDGFVDGDELIFKVFNKNEIDVFDADHEFRASVPPKDLVFRGGGASDIASIQAFYRQAVDTKVNLNLWSTYLLPKSTSFDDMFGTQTQVREVRDDQGKIWTPTGGAANTLTDYTPGYGYEVYADSIHTVTVQGSKVPLSQVSVSLVGNQQSTLIGNPYESAENVETAFSGYAANVYAVDKYVNDGTGFISIETYSPMFAINNWVDKNMQPGEAYYTFALAPEPSLTFPAPTGPFVARKKSGNDGSAVEKTVQHVKSANKYMHVMLPIDAWSFQPEPGSEIRAYDLQNNPIGRVVIQPTGALVILDGWSMTEGEAFQLKVWSPVSHLEHTLEVTDWRRGDGVYTNHRVAVAGSIQEGLISELNDPIKVFPNPATVEIKIAFKVQDGSEPTEVYLTNSLGQRVRAIEAKNYTQGEYQIKLDTRGLEIGLYFLKIRQGDVSEVRKIILQ